MPNTVDSQSSTQEKKTSWTITFDPNGGTIQTTTQVIQYPASGTENVPVKTVKELGLQRDGYAFLGWSWEQEIDLKRGGFLEDGFSMSNSTGCKDTTLYAVWSPAITFDANGGTIQSPTQSIIRYEVWYGSTLRLVSTVNLDSMESLGLQRDGYALIGWAKTPDGEVCYNDGELLYDGISEIKKAEPMKLYALWTTGEYQATPDTVADIISGLPSGTTFKIKVTGGWDTSSDETILAIKKAMQTNKQRYISLDLSESSFLFGLPTAAFAGCSMLKEIILPATSTIMYKINERAFMNCTGLKTLTLNANHIGIDVVSGCTNLQELHFGRYVEYLGGKRYSGKTSEALFDRNLSSLSTITVDSQNTNFKVVDGVLYSYDEARLLFCPRKADITEYVIPNTVKTIDENAFYCTNIEKIYIPLSVEYITDWTFYSNEDFVINCAAESKPNGWGSQWYDSLYENNITVNWGVTNP